ncbi:MAG: hypothetical protein GXO02_05985, partial [Epsilonproteobacteria bacterium]|nr:hypothetical protein [Campylobacterota bacterium]
MQFTDTTKKVIAYILAFPAITLLLYAIISYYIFFVYQSENNKIILDTQTKTLSSIYKSSLITKVNSLDKVLGKKRDNKEILEFLKSINLYDNSTIVILDKDNKIIYSSHPVKKDLLNKFQNIKGNRFYEDDKYIAYSSSKNNKGLKVIGFVDKDIYLSRLKSLKEQLSKNAQESIRNSLLILGIMWFVTLGLSIFIARVVYNKLQTYKKALHDSNKSIIFQSRQAMLGELLPMIAHQWRQPINKIASVLMRMRFELAKD